MSNSKPSVDSLFKRPYPSRRKQQAAKRSPKSSANKMLLRVLAVLVALLVITIVVIVKDIGKSQMASGTLMSTE